MMMMRAAMKRQRARHHHHHHRHAARDGGDRRFEATGPGRRTVSPNATARRRYAFKISR
jgi:fatty acid desaturase